MSSAVDRVIAALDAAGCKPRRSGSGWQARCPAHDDRDPSLGVSEGDDGRALLTCRAGCDSSYILDRLGLDWTDLFTEDTRPARPPDPEWVSVVPVPKDAVGPQPHHKLGLETARWAYRNASGQLLGWVLRWDSKRGKEIRPLTWGRLSNEPAGSERWDWRSWGGQAPLYGLDLLAAHPDVPALVVEGEKTAHAAQDYFDDILVAVTSPGGSSRAHKADWSPLAGRNVTIWPDADAAGRKYAEAVAELAHKAGAASVRIVQVPETWPAGWDLADPPQDDVDLGAMLEAAVVWTPRPSLVAVPDPYDPLRQAKTLDELEVALRNLKASTLHVDQIARQVVRERAIEALKASDLKVSSPAKLVSAALDSEPAANGTGNDLLLLREIEPDPNPVDGAALLGDIRQTLRRFLVLAPGAETAVALWTVHAHAHEASPISPILGITSPVKRCGKTTLLDVVQALVPRPLPLSNITAAAMFRVIEGRRPTVLVDEADTYFRDSDDLRGVINSGHKRSMAYVIRTVGDDHEPAQFSTWAPKAVALIGRLPDTTEDRSIVVEMRRKTTGEMVERFKGHQTGETLLPLARRIARWAADHLDVLRDAEPKIPDALHDRAADNWRPLLAIADRAGGEWPSLARDAARELLGRGDENEPSGVQALEDLRTMFVDRAVDRLTSEEIVEHFVSLEDRPWPEYRHDRPLTKRQLASLLRRFGITPKVVRVSGKTPRGYLIEDCTDAFTRYIPPSEPQHRYNARPHCVSADSEAQHAEPVLRIENTGKLNAGADCCAVALPQAPSRAASVSAAPPAPRNTDRALPRDLASWPMEPRMFAEARIKDDGLSEVDAIKMTAAKYHLDLEGSSGISTQQPTTPAADTARRQNPTQGRTR